MGGGVGGAEVQLGGLSMLLPKHEGGWIHTCCAERGCRTTPAAAGGREWRRSCCLPYHRPCCQQQCEPHNTGQLRCCRFQHSLWCGVLLMDEKGSVSEAHNGIIIISSSSIGIGGGIGIASKYQACQTGAGPHLHAARPAAIRCAAMRRPANASSSKPPQGLGDS